MPEEDGEIRRYGEEMRRDGVELRIKCGREEMKRERR